MFGIMRKSLVVFLVILLLTSAVLVGCTEPEAAAPTTPTPTTPAPTTPTPPAEPAPEVINLKYSSPYLDVEAPTRWGNYMCDLIEEKTNGLVKIERFTGGVLGSMPEHLGLASSGAVDLVGLHCGLYGRELALNGLGQEGNQFATRQQAVENVIKFRENSEVKALMEAEAADNNIKIFDWNMAGPSGLSCRESATSLADLKGKKVSAWDAPARASWEERGLIPVNVQIPETYESLSRGVIDVGFAALNAHNALKLYEVAKTYIDLRVVMCEMPMAMNLTRWAEMPANVQQAILEASRETVMWSAELDEKETAEIFAKFEEAGMEVVTLSYEESKHYQEVGQKYEREVGLADLEAIGLKAEGELIWKVWDEIYQSNMITE